MKTFKQFQEQTTNLPRIYTDYKAPAVQAAHLRSMQRASKMRQAGMNAIAIDPKDEAEANINAGKPGGRGVAKPLGGTTSYSPLKKRLTGDGKIKVGDPGVRIEQWYAKPTSQTTDSDGNTTTTFTTPDGKTQTVRQTKREKEEAARINNKHQPKPGDLW